MGKKIVIIGSGSLVFSKTLTIDCLSYDHLKDSHFALVDIDEDRLKYSGQIVDRIINDNDLKNASYSMHTDRKEALQDADAVIIAILVGGYEPIALETDIPMKYGVDISVGDTLSPGGVMRCLRTLPVLIEIAKDIVEICPNAWALNYTNPMAMLTWGMQKAVPELKIVGLCHSVQGGAKLWAKRLGIDSEEINFECAGINHQAWYTKFEHNGKDLLPEIRKKCVEQKIWNGETSKMEILKHFGYPVSEGAAHVSEYSAWFRKRPELVQRYGHRDDNHWNGMHGLIKEIYDRPDWKDKMKEMANRDVKYELKRSHEYGSMIISALFGGEDEVIYGNVMNNGHIDNLPRESNVEVACHVSKNGIKPIHYGNLPSQLAAINIMQISVQKLAVEAALEVNPEKVFNAIAMDPLTGAVLDLDSIRDMTIELMEAHKQWIPAFNDKKLEAKPQLDYVKEAGNEWIVDSAEENINS